MNFFQQQDRARHKSALLVFGFFISIGLVLGLIDVLIFFSKDPITISYLSYINLGVVSTIVLGSFVQYCKLRNGGKSLTNILGATIVTRDTSDQKITQLLNVVDEIAIASGIAAPSIFVLEQETGINAFVAGYNPNNTVLVVTQGTLDNLSRDELQGVIAHEYSHIYNSDATLNLRLLIVLAGLLLLTQIGFRLIRVRDKKGQIVMVGAALLAFGYIAYFCGTVLRAAISRQRESLADASAVQFTRNSEGITRALLKIQKQGKKALMHNGHAEEINHMCFSMAQKNYFSNVFATHPKLDLRIAQLDPTGEVTQQFADNQNPKTKQSTPSKSKQANAGAQFTGMAAMGAMTAIPTATIVLNSIGNPTAASFAAATTMLGSIPENLKSMLNQTDSVQALVYAVFLSADVTVNYSVLNLAPEVNQLIPECLKFEELKDPTYRLVLLDLAIPTLKLLSQEQINQLVQNTYALVKADNKLSILEVAELTIITQRLLPDAYKQIKAKYVTAKNIGEELVYILAFLAQQGPKESELQEKAFIDSTRHLLIEVKDRLVSKQLNIPKLLESLKVLRFMAPALKQQFLEACLLCINNDGQVDATEAQLLRAICACLDCPLPPLAAQQV